MNGGMINHALVVEVFALRSCISPPFTLQWPRQLKCQLAFEQRSRYNLNCLRLNNTLLTWALLDVWMFGKYRGQRDSSWTLNDVWHIISSNSTFQNKCFNIFITLLKVLNHFLSPPSPPPSLLLPFSIDCPLLLSWELWVLCVWFPCIFQSYPSIIISLSLSWQWIYPNPSSSRPCSLNSFLFYIFRQPLLSLDLFLNP